MSVTRRPFGAFGVAALAALAFATPTFAQSDLIVTFDAHSGGITRSRTIDISDLRLATASGRSAVKNRITKAARQVCDYQSMSVIRKSADYDRCFESARNNAMRQVNGVQTASLN
jgi:UrcA family protein